MHDTENMIQVIDAKPGDGSIIYEMVKEMTRDWAPGFNPPASGEKMDHLLFQLKGAEAVIAYCSGQPAGFCFFNYTASSQNCRPSIQLDNLFVKRAYRRKGIGTALYRHMLDRAKQENLLGLQFFPPAGRLGDIAFYSAMGLMPAEARLNYTVNL